MRKLMLAQGCGNWKVYIVRSMRTVFRPHGCRSVGSVLIFTTPEAPVGRGGACARQSRRRSRQFTIESMPIGRGAGPDQDLAILWLPKTQGLLV